MQVQLSNGRTLTFSLATITHIEFMNYCKPDVLSDDEKTAIFKKITGITEAEADDLPEADWRLVRDTFSELCFPSDPKNSQGASTSPEKA